MGITKNAEMTDPNSCWNKAKPDEPVFVLRGQDDTAAYIITRWLEANPGISDAKRAEANACREAMLNYHTRKRPD